MVFASITVPRMMTALGSLCAPSPTRKPSKSANAIVNDFLMIILWHNRRFVERHVADPDGSPGSSYRLGA